MIEELTDKERNLLRKFRRLDLYDQLRADERINILLENPKYNRIPDDCRKVIQLSDK